MSDDEILTIVGYEALPVTSGLGLCIVRLGIGRPHGDYAYTLIIGLDPRSASIVWVARIKIGFPSETIDPTKLPYTCRDLAETLCREKFPNATAPTQ